MLIEEAKWLGSYICSLENDSFPLANVGSSTEETRKHVQPHIDEWIFKPLREQYKKVFHIDIKSGEGVDLIGDLNDSNFIEEIKRLGMKSVLCSNLLEHVTDPQSICSRLQDMVDSGSQIIVTVPYQYPYHKDPIDTKFRPSVDRLCQLFPDCQLVQGGIITSFGNQAKTLWSKICQGKLFNVLMIMKRWILPLHGMDEWRKARTDVLHLFQPYQITYVVLKKN